MTYRVCSFPGCDRKHFARGWCKTHSEQTRRGRTPTPITPRPPRRRLTDSQIDGALLLIARGAATEDAAAYFGVSIKQLRTQLEAECHQAWRDADDARWTTPHGTRARYRRGCRCWDCKAAQRAKTATGQRWVGIKDREQQKRRDIAAVRSVYEQTRARADNHGQEWTGPELEFLARRDGLTHQQKAAHLGRTIYAVRHMLHKLHAGDPRTVELAGLSRPFT